jgi:Flp pilus assembly protein TadG
MMVNNSLRKGKAARLYRSDRYGQAVVEFAIVLPVLLLIMIGLINLGFLINAQLILTQAAWEGARTGATLDPSIGEGDAEIQGAVQASLQGLQDPSGVLITISPDESARAAMAWPLPRGQALQVQLSYPFQLALPLPINLTLGAQATSRIEYSNAP